MSLSSSTNEVSKLKSELLSSDEKLKEHQKENEQLNEQILELQAKYEAEISIAKATKEILEEKLQATYLMFLAH